MDEILRDDCFTFGNSDDRTKPADNESGVAPPEPGVASFTIPFRIGSSESNAVQQQIQQLIMTEFDRFYPEVIISYATGRRPTSDVEGAGPGLYVATTVIKALIGSEILCFSGLMTPARMNWKEYFLHLENANARLLVALLSKAFFQSIACLEEVHGAIGKDL